MEQAQEPAPEGTLLGGRKEGDLVGRRYGDRGTLWAAATYKLVWR